MSHVSNFNVRERRDHNEIFIQPNLDRRAEKTKKVAEGIFKTFGIALGLGGVGIVLGGILGAIPGFFIGGMIFERLIEPTIIGAAIGGTIVATIGVVGSIIIGVNCTKDLVDSTYKEGYESIQKEFNSLIKRNSLKQLETVLEQYIKRGAGFKDKINRCEKSIEFVNYIKDLKEEVSEDLSDCKGELFEELIEVIEDEFAEMDKKRNGGNGDHFTCFRITPRFLKSDEAMREIKDKMVNRKETVLSRWKERKRVEKEKRFLKEQEKARVQEEKRSSAIQKHIGEIFDDIF